VNKPRIAQVLGVEVGEEFTYDFGANQVNRGAFKIGADGKRYYKTGDLWNPCYNEDDLAVIINHPDRIIRKSKQEQEEKKADKPLKDWTLGDVKMECASHDDCEGCHFHGSAFCDQRGVLCPDEWDLSEKPRFTRQEVERAKAIKVLYPVVKTLAYVDIVGQTFYMYDDEDNYKGSLDNLDETFPTLRSIRRATLDEIIGGAQ
jgi:hypothetical protein